MRRSLERLFAALLVFLLFTGATILFYFSFVSFEREYKMYHHNDRPNGQAVEVTNDVSFLERLMLFYETGE